MLSKSVHITNYYHRNSGGISTSYNNLLAAAERHKRYIVLIVPGEKDEVEQVNEYAKIYYVAARQSPIFDKRYRMIMPWQFMQKGTRIREILLAEKPDMIEICDKYSLSLMGAMIRTNNFKKLGRPMLVHFSCERMDDNVASYISRSKIGKWFSRCIMGKYNFGLYDFHLANSTYTAEEFYDSIEKPDTWFSKRLLNFSWRFFKAAKVPYQERIFVCPRGVDSEKYNSQRQSDEIKRKMREHAGIPADSTVLLYAGRISPEKNIGLLLDFMKILAKDEKRDFRLVIAGMGPQAEWLKNETAKQIPNKIVQLGHIDKETLADYYANADVFVHPNPKEPFGIAPLEAMASGVPVVAPNSGGILSYATDENTWLVEPTGKAFAEAINEVINHPELTKQKIVKALETTQNNTWEKSTERLLMTYNRIFADFEQRKELFAYQEKPADFDFAKEFQIAVFFLLCFLSQSFG